MWVTCLKMSFLELAARKISVCYLKLPQERTPIVPHFSWILVTDSQIKEKTLKASLKIVVTKMR